MKKQKSLWEEIDSYNRETKALQDLAEYVQSEEFKEKMDKVIDKAVEDYRKEKN